MPEGATPLRSREILALLGLVAVALILRLPGLTESVWYDEVWATRIRLQSAGRLVDSLRFDVHPPLYSVLMFGWIRVFGDSELSIRIPSLLAGSGTLVLVFLLGRRLVPPPGAWIAAALLCVSPVHIWYSQEARHYALLVFLVLLAIEAFYRIRREEGGRLWWWIHGLAAVAAVLTHYYAIAFIGILAAITLVERPPGRRWMLTIHGATALSLAAFLGWRARFGALSTGLGHLSSFDAASAADLFFDWFLTGDAVFIGPEWRDLPHAVGPWAVWALAGMVFVAGVLTVARTRYGLHLLLYLSSIPALLATMRLVGFEEFYIERSALPALPFFLLVLAAGLGQLRPPPVRATALALTLAGALAVLAGLYTRRDTWTVYKQNPDWRSAAAALSGDLASPAPVIVFTTSPALPLLYYGLELSHRRAGRDDVVGTHPRAAEPSDGLLGRINAMTAFGGPDEHPPPYSRGARDELIALGQDPLPVVRGVLARAGVDRFILIHNEYWSGDHERVSGLLQRAFVVRSRRSFKGLELIEMVLR